MLHFGLDLSRKRVDTCLISDGSELLGHFPAPADRTVAWVSASGRGVWRVGARRDRVDERRAVVHNELIAHDGWEGER